MPQESSPNFPNATENTLYQDSGKVCSNDPVVSLLYDLLRDHIQPGDMENLVHNTSSQMTYYSNGWLAQYAINIRDRLKK